MLSFSLRGDERRIFTEHTALTGERCRKYPHTNRHFSISAHLYLSIYVSVLPYACSLPDSLQDYTAPAADSLGGNIPVFYLYVCLPVCLSTRSYCRI